MRSKAGVLTAALVCISLFMAISAHARCVQSALAGTWNIHVWMTSHESGDASWMYCTLTIKPDGTVGPGNCMDDTGSKSRILGGKLTLSSACVITGFINSQGGGGTADKQTINHGVLTRDGEYAAMLGTSAGGGPFRVDCFKK